MARAKSVIVLGGGVVGMCTTLSLQERGLLVTAVTGEALAERIAGRPVAAQLAPFAIERF